MKRDHQSTQNEPEEAGNEAIKKSNNSFSSADIHGFFNEKIWKDKFQQDIKSEIDESQPYRWGTIVELMNDKLLRQVRKEVLSEIAFTKKETDIYKVFQLGDLANLSGLNWDDLLRLPSLSKLRAAIYSQEFRDVVSKVTGCGELSGVKTDMLINTYTKGCHLLTHDDVIGLRRVSFILYMPEPDKEWKENYGGALRLFPAIVPNVPASDFQCKLVPQFNQIAFFTVQPGLLFHEVEEVRVDKQRLLIQGWFHIPQRGEKGFIEGEQEATEAKSTLQLLQSKEIQDYEFPKLVRDDIPTNQTANFLLEFTEDDWEYLRLFLNPAYLNPVNLQHLQEEFTKESVVEISSLLNDDYANSLRSDLSFQELEMETPRLVTEVKHPWKTAIPSLKQRFLYIDGKSPFCATEKTTRLSNVGPQELPNFELLKHSANLSSGDSKLIDIAAFLKLSAFRKWLVAVTGVIPTSDQILVRRFRPGQDFVLATTIDKDVARNDQELDSLLEATFNLTPSAVKKLNWESGEFGGYELCMVKDDDENDDPAVYRASGNNDDSVLYTSQCKWNLMTLILRDPLVLKFIKYVSINAKGSRWDISCQWNVKEGSEEDGDEDENDENDENQENMAQEQKAS